MNTGIFPPGKRTGLLFHSILLVILVVLTSWATYNVSNTSAGLPFVIFLVVAILAFVPIPFLAYRAYALYRAKYILDRNSLELRWGLRNEIIPLSDIEWVRPVDDLTRPLASPPLSTPGAILGFQRHRDLGVVEFLASARRQLLLVATPKRVYAISPADASNFLETFARAVELGSLRPTPSKSLYPTFVITQAWESGLARFEWLATIFLNLGLVAWVSLLIPSMQGVALGSQPDQPAQVVPAVQLVLVPVVSIFLNLLGWAAGLFYYRWPKWRNLSMLLWASGVLSSLVFLIAVVFIVSTPI